jgi:hypothetical protein
MCVDEWLVHSKKAVPGRLAAKAASLPGGSGFVEARKLPLAVDQGNLTPGLSGVIPI